MKFKPDDVVLVAATKYTKTYNQYKRVIVYPENYTWYYRDVADWVSIIILKATAAKSEIIQELYART